MTLLDTCVLLWLAADPSALSSSAADLLRTGGGGLFVSAISGFEIGQKAAAGKLTLARPIDHWFPAMLERHGLVEIPINGIVAARATLLPAIHRDPFDRLLIATAQHHRLTLLTPDPTIGRYPNLMTAW